MFNNDDDEMPYGQAGNRGQVESLVTDLELEARRGEARRYLRKRGLWPPAPLVPGKRPTITLIAQLDVNGELPL